MSRCSRTRNCAFAGNWAWRAGARDTGHGGGHGHQGARAAKRLRLDGFLYRRPFRLWQRRPGTGHQSPARTERDISVERTGLIGGYEAGYNWQLANHSVLGVEADASFTSPVELSTPGTLGLNSTIDYVSTVRGRVGYAFGTWMPYVTGGFAWAHTHVNLNDNSAASSPRLGRFKPGGRPGAGVEFAVSGNWSAKLEYDYISLASRTYDLSSFGLPGRQGRSQHQSVQGWIELSLWRRCAVECSGCQCKGRRCPIPTSGTSTRKRPSSPRPIRPSAPPIRGANSLPGGGQTQGDLDHDGVHRRSPVAGRRVLFQSRAGAGLWHWRHARRCRLPERRSAKGRRRRAENPATAYYFKQTFGLGGGQEDVDDGPNQLSGKRDIDRITLIIGRFAVGGLLRQQTATRMTRVPTS